MTVFVTMSDRSKDFSDAERFGELVFLSDRFTYPDELEKHNAEEIGALPPSTRYRLMQTAQAYDPTRDWLLPHGDMAHILFFARHCRGPLRILRFDRIERQYVPIIIQ